MPWHIVVDRLEPLTLFSFRWRPYAIHPNRDYSREPMTLVTFVLADAEGGGCQLAICDPVPSERCEQDRIAPASANAW
jgi:hypothetical protein